MLPSSFSVVPTTGGLGAELQGVDVKTLDEQGFNNLLDAWAKHSVLLLRNQNLTDDELISFSMRFGALDWAPIQETGRRFVEGKPELYIVSNVKDEKGNSIGSLGYGEAVWHTDMSYLEEPPIGSMLYALEVPKSGGFTWFTNMYTVYENLPEELKKRIEGLKIKHDGTYNSGGFLRQGVAHTDDPVTSTGAVHPLVITHPVTKRKCLYLGRRRLGYIIGLSLADSEKLLDELWARITGPTPGSNEFTWYNDWKVGDLVIWDNRCTMHRRDAFDENDRRILHRTQIKGTAKPSSN